MNAQRNGSPTGREPMVVVKTLFVERMAGFVHDGVQTRKRIGFVKPGGETGVSRPQAC